MTATKTLGNFKSADVFDSRDFIERIEELESERDAFEVTCRECGGAMDVPGEACPSSGEDELPHLPDSTWAEENPVEAAELAALQAFAEDASGCADWAHGEVFIRDSYFKDYAKEMAEDIGAISMEATWPNNYIDWDSAADALQQDYTSFELDGVTFWARS
jgi:hypothetical protein